MKMSSLGYALDFFRGWNWDTEVDQLDRVVICDKNVLGTQITMDNADARCLAECLTDRNH